MGAVKVAVDIGQLAVSLNTNLKGLVLNQVSSEQPPGFLTHLVMDCLSPCAQWLSVYTRIRKSDILLV